jgi:hypothetical protein
MVRMGKLNMETRHMSSCGETELIVGEDIVTSRRQGRKNLDGTVLVVLVSNLPIVPRLFVLQLRWHPSVCGYLAMRRRFTSDGYNDEPLESRCLG